MKTGSILRMWSVIILLGFITIQFSHAQQGKRTATLFRSIHCQVMSPEGLRLPVFAYRNMKNADEVILISKMADHALLVNFRTHKAYKVPKPLLGVNTVTVSDERPAVSGHIGFAVHNVPGKKGLVEIIVHFEGENCFLCGAQQFAAIWD
ncbi:MAG: hypothetical protein QHI48_00300 [Bacteroidota bacterium]|nr:hypothetical protein [Bacteroidota bacterium]